MKDTLKLENSLKQQQRLTPMQVKYVRMLEMTAPEIEEEVRRAVDDMPALEAKDPDDTGHPDETSTDTAVAAYHDDTPYYNRRAYNRSSDDEYYDAVAAAPERSETLIEALARQMSLLDMEDADRVIATHIIGNLDDNGYITRDLQSIADDVATTSGILVDTDRVGKVWQQVRRLDPAGVGAVDLRDCLVLQLKRLPRNDTNNLATEIVSHYFDLFSKKHFTQLLAALDIDEDALKRAMAVIARLNPKPGGAYASGRAGDDTPRHVVPDFAIEIDEDRLTLRMLNRIPELSIERTFTDDTPISDGTPRSRRDAVNMFIKSKRDEAQGFIKVLSMRQETLYRVMQAIVKIQRDFFLTGDEAMIRPMVLRDIKELTGYGLSVISRATAGKYVTTPHGTYPLRLLFNERPKDTSDISVHQILAALRELIEHEDSEKPLSDELLTSHLSQQGFDVARRTVAKYRERLGFPVARLRRKI
ncbi:MAG: RNA polymerase factor sigma-54 [Clostridiales bacterium]|nr:RNA polymerase factor sigma-54 [Clostridiales bacterium]